MIVTVAEIDTVTEDMTLDDPVSELFMLTDIVCVTISGDGDDLDDSDEFDALLDCAVDSAILPTKHKTNKNNA